MERTPETKGFRELQRAYLVDTFGFSQVPGARSIPEERVGDFEIRTQLDAKERFFFQELIYRSEVITSNRPEATARHGRFASAARGDVLVVGLELGAAVTSVLERTEVTSVTILEPSRALASLVYSHICEEGRTSLIVSDPLEWEPPSEVMYESAYVSLWRDRELFLSSKAQVNHLRERYGRFVKNTMFPWSGRGGTRSGSGRPPGKAGKKKSYEKRMDETITTRFSTADRGLLERAAKRFGLRVTALVRAGAIAEAEKLLNRTPV